MPLLTTLSVILPVLDERDNLAQLVPEIVNALGATLSEFEVIVVDDSSTDGTDLLMQELTTKGIEGKRQLWSLSKYSRPPLSLRIQHRRLRSPQQLSLS